MAKSKGKRFKSKVVKGAQRKLPLKGLRAPKATKAPTKKREWNTEWGSPLLAVRLQPPGLAAAWNKYVGKRDRAQLAREAIAKACGFNLAAATKAEAK